MNAFSPVVRSAHASADALAARLRREHLVYAVDGLLYATALADFDAVAEAAFEPVDDPAIPVWRGVFADERGSGPVLSLHQILDPELAGATAGAAKAGEQRLMIFSQGGSRYAVQVDHCLGVFPIRSAARLPLDGSPLLRRQHSGCRAVVKWKDQLLVVLTPSSLVSTAMESVLQTRLAEWTEAKNVSVKEPRTATAAGESVPAAGVASSLQGTLAGGMLPQVFQIVWLRKLTGEMILDSGDCTLTLYWNGGEVIHARNGAGLTPGEALHKALQTRAGRYQFRNQPLTGVARTLNAATPQLIREAARAVASAAHA